MSLKPSLRVALVVLMCLGLASPLLAQKKKWAVWTFQTENDIFVPGEHTDEHYTNGLRLLALRRPGKGPGWAQGLADRLSKKLCPKTKTLNTVGFAIGQSIYTPDDITIPTFIPADRPYAGYLYGSLLVQVTDGFRQHAFELQFGLVGPNSGAEWTQTQFHKVINDDQPMGWDFQLPNEPTIELTYRFSRRFGGQNLDFVPHAGGSLGTVMVMADAGFTARAGFNISGFPLPDVPNTIAPKDVRADPAALADFQPEIAKKDRPDWEAYVFAGAEGRAVAHNIFLDGTVFSNSHSVDKEDFVYDLRAGFSIRYKSFRLNYTFIRRSREFSPPRGRGDGIHEYGSISLGVERAF